mmetsp:Transcript_4717/g.11139  ORF Transcript_4717/g.11139 Transcript_4717/m.11139 type:complete len:220 (-) Transcript_4717:1-660(-)
MLSRGRQPTPMRWMHARWHFLPRKLRKPSGAGVTAQYTTVVPLLNRSCASKRCRVTLRVATRLRAAGKLREVRHRITNVLRWLLGPRCSAPHKVWNNRRTMGPSSCFPGSASIPPLLAATQASLLQEIRDRARFLSPCPFRHQRRWEAIGSWRNLGGIDGSATPHSPECVSSGAGAHRGKNCGYSTGRVVYDIKWRRTTRMHLPQRSLKFLELTSRGAP